ncbi:hypothetical protein [Paenibacillus piri]|uniref:Uncharacterized protein n=1 Tax=Paenibacillus piri TaxID=2547395 RepID=A0A4R5KU02_9BACL|nr:hypothetical protein [Paenibacillus piri]TDF99186.1 hypothetical protein E1757_04805 [Paenibacillus piri]
MKGQRDRLLESPTLAEAIASGWELIGAHPIRRSAKLHVPADESLRTVVQLLRDKRGNAEERIYR